MTADRAQKDTGTRECGLPTRKGTPCRKKIAADAEACARHSEEAEQARADAKARFLEEFDGTWGEAQAAAERAGISRAMVYQWREHDEEFRRDWLQKALENSKAYKEVCAEAALVGVLKPVIYQGKITGWYRERDLATARFMLQALDPAYSSKASVSVNVERDPAAEEGFARLFASKGGMAALQAAIDETVDGIVDAEIVEDE